MTIPERAEADNWLNIAVKMEDIWLAVNSKRHKQASKMKRQEMLANKNLHASSDLSSTFEASLRS